MDGQTTVYFSACSCAQVLESSTLENDGVPCGMIGWDLHSTQLLVDDISLGLVREAAVEDIPFFSSHKFKSWKFNIAFSFQHLHHI